MGFVVIILIDFLLLLLILLLLLGWGMSLDLVVLGVVSLILIWLNIVVLLPLLTVVLKAGPRQQCVLRFDALWIYNMLRFAIFISIPDAIHILLIIVSASVVNVVGPYKLLATISVVPICIIAPIHPLFPSFLWSLFMWRISHILVHV